MKVIVQEDLEQMTCILIHKWDKIPVTLPKYIAYGQVQHCIYAHTDNDFKSTMYELNMKTYHVSRYRYTVPNDVECQSIAMMAHDLKLYGVNSFDALLQFDTQTKTFTWIRTWYTSMFRYWQRASIIVQDMLIVIGAAFQEGTTFYALPLQRSKSDWQKQLHLLWISQQLTDVTIKH